MHIFHVDTAVQLSRQAHIDVRPVRCHHFHCPLPKVIAAIVFWALTMMFGGMVGRGHKRVTTGKQSSVKPISQFSQAIEAFVNRRTNWRSNLNTLGQNVDGRQVRRGYVVAFHGTRHQLAVWWLQFQTAQRWRIWSV